MAHNPEPKYLTDLIGLTHFWQKQKNKQLDTSSRDIFARHRMDIGRNTDIKIKQTPKDDKAVHSQNLPMPIHLKEDLIVKLALIHKYGIIRVLPFSMYGSPICALRKPNGKSTVQFRMITWQFLTNVPSDWISRDSFYANFAFFHQNPLWLRWTSRNSWTSGKKP